MGITAYDLTVDRLDMHADKRTFHRSVSTIENVFYINFIIVVSCELDSTLSTPSTILWGSLDYERSS
jgi:hypothetical protein